MKSTHQHPHPSIDRITQYGAAALCVVMVLAAAAQVFALVLGAPGAFVLTALLTLAFVPFMLLLTVATPALTVTDEGLTLKPRVWREQVVRWDGVCAIKDYPLLPPEDAEALRKAFVGRKRYHAAQGKMLVIPSLPIQYRVTGWLAGEGFTPVIAVTNRTHSSYEQLLQQLERHLT